MRQPLYRDADNIVMQGSLWQHTGHGAAWTVRDIVDGTVHAESMDRRDRTEFPVSELLADYVQI